MAQPGTSLYTVSDFLQWAGANQLQIATKFQRRSVWVEKAKSYLVDTIVREKPVPPIFLRLKADTTTRSTIREVVDGQQRIRSVIAYVSNEFPILKAHNEELAGMYYDDLPDELKQRVLQYAFFVFTLSNVTDEDVLDIFARFNTYSVALNAQELRNANFTGLFKRTAYLLAHRYYKFWTQNGVFTDRDVARMREVEFVSELLVMTMAGIQSTNKRELDQFYEAYDDDFPLRARLISRFDAVMDVIGEMFAGRMANSIFRRRPIVFSLFTAIYSLKYGIPGVDAERLKFTAQQVGAIRERLKRFDQQMQRDEVPEKYFNFFEAMNRATGTPVNREIRNETLIDLMLSARTA